ncbi:MAG: hypothetical protein A2033_13245 [Bacteroidetes bacterium GWA2_31_9]|nr:MAG: hypothetical protein A2033_13245 [Bacteroidetes bacterium GWA2_31_9]
MSKTLKTTYYKIRLGIIFIYLFFNLACEKRVDWDIKSDNNELIAVEGVITNEKKAHIIKLTKSSHEMNSMPIPISGADITIVGGAFSDILEENPIGSGHYYTDSTFIGITGNKYVLTISIENKAYYANAHMIPVTQIEAFKYSYSEEKKMNKIDWVTNSYEPEDPSMYEIILDWSSVAGFENKDADSCKAVLYYYSLPTLDVNQIFIPEAETVYFPNGTIATERKYSLTKEHCDFIRSLLSETRLRGGFFDSSPSNIKTNLSNGAVGFFGACSVISTTFEIQ